MATEPNLALKAALEPSPEDLAVVQPPRRRWWLAGVGLLLGGTGLGLALFGRGDSAQWETQPATTGNLTTTVTAVGSIEPLTTVEVGSDLTGRVSSVRVEQNASVRAGDVLAELDPESFEASVAQATASVSSAAAAVEKARVALADAEASRDRTARLEARGAGRGCSDRDGGCGAGCGPGVGRSAVSGGVAGPGARLRREPSRICARPPSWLPSTE
jgi:HlyD family secretion protein